ncbi:MAG: beta-ketoacyl-[acyl-carrier-protein] synthase family protein [Novipirellula sp. JB048]
MDRSPSRRVVITGRGVVSPLGLDCSAMLSALRTGTSGVRPFTQLPLGVLSVDHGAEAIEFTGEIANYGPLEKALQRTIRKGSKVMCREIEMGVAVAQRALHDSALSEDKRVSERVGVVYGSDNIMSWPDEFSAGLSKCMDEEGRFDFDKWGSTGRPQVNPLWLLKYLPNMPASHIAIYNNLRGPNNSITVREASGGAALGEAVSTIVRGHADALIVGATGSRVHPLRTLHASLQERLAEDTEDPAKMSRPFDVSRDGSVLGEGAAAIVCESLEHAEARGATILGEVVGYSSSAVGSQAGDDFIRIAVRNVLKGALGQADPRAIGHIHAHGLGTVDGDRCEAEAIAEVFGPPTQQPPVTTAKGHFGNLGAGGSMVEIVASLDALGGELFPIMNCNNLDPACPINACVESGVPAGDEFVSVNVTPQGQASAVRIRRFA